MALTQVSSGGIKDGSITNADLDASASITGSKVNPNFDDQNVVTTGTVTGAALIPSDNTTPTNGVYLPATNTVGVATDGTGRLFVDENGNVTINDQGDLRFADSDSSNWVAFQAPATIASDVTWTLPDADGASGQVLSTNGSGNLSWADSVGVLVTDGGNFNNGTSVLSTSQFPDGGQF